MDFRTRPARILFGAHRGFRALAPENTLPAFELAASAGADFIELDVACTRDRRLVILHDDSLARTTNAGTAFRDGRLAACERSFAEVRSLDAGSWFLEKDPFGTLASGRLDARKASGYRGLQVPALEEALELAKRLGIGVNVEIKDHAKLAHDATIVEDTLGAVRDAGMEDSVLVSSFSSSYLVRAATEAPGIPRALLVENKRPWDPVESCRQACAQWYHPSEELILGCHLVCLQRAGIFVTAWTVNDPALALQLSLMGVTGFITDDPESIARPFPNRPPAA